MHLFALAAIADCDDNSASVRAANACLFLLASGVKKKSKDCWFHTSSHSFITAFDCAEHRKCEFGDTI